MKDNPITENVHDIPPALKPIYDFVVEWGINQVDIPPSDSTSKDPNP
jgi:hypothetical protein